ncbi:SGNH/GDSL hydrolase family protein [Aeromicrobium sp. YIM 150415]|uniref:SGNH/GDSL hydrolase family protein n=1 Tax=Aeromicrobium sp. YIM 150415 TaxID=2803912 RepID=UPI00196372C6|nr:SGNH/GDSL hydrolase family protein [Aeromicrobium sp. YIM 150415]MBM9463251.1 SGNH/GDSL hydrolase family protein [Aeromicrobium sp. YIM 150415]
MQVSLIALMVVLLAASLAVSPTPASAEPENAASPSEDGGGEADLVPQSERAEILGEGWESSDDKIIVGRGDATGFHVLLATEKSGYKWKTLASLREPSLETDRWVGNVCLTGDGMHAAVVYAPRGFTNDDALMERGGFAAVVALEDGAVTRLPFTSTMAYFNPGCGAGTGVAFSRFKSTASGQDGAESEIRVVDAASSQETLSASTNGQLTSAIPVEGGVVAAAAGSIVHVDSSGAVEELAHADAAVDSLTLSGDGGLAFMATTEDERTMMELDDLSSPSESREVYQGESVKLKPTADNTPLLVGPDLEGKKLATDALQVQTESSIETSWRGGAVVVETPTPEPYLEPGKPEVNPEWEDAMTLKNYTPGVPRPIELSLQIAKTGRTIDFVIEPAVVPDGADEPTAADVGPQASSDTIDTAATCAIPRNDPHTQVYQPTPRQVEWAANQAVTGNLNVTRSANWKEAGMPSAWSPQGLFPSQGLSGGGRVPTQVMLGIMAQESNLWQASGHSLSGIPGNPLIGNYYGRAIYDDEPEDDFDIDWADADCGYGVSQVTDGMRKGGSFTGTQQRAIAVDYASNIAAGLQILQSKWNEAYDAGVIHDDGDPADLENWIFAIWAYNSGFHPDEGNGQPWGLGWVNNPANPMYPPGRGMFAANPNDPAHPQDWPYTEKVIGFAAYSIATPDGPGFRPAWWISDNDRQAAQPPRFHFCTDDNDCYPGQSIQPNHPDVSNAKPGPCGHQDGSGLYDLKCWWNQETSYHWCGGNYCGNELLRFNSSYPEQPDGTNNPPMCSTVGLPANAIVVDNVPTSAPPINTSQRPCTPNHVNSGTFSLNFPEVAAGNSPARVDFHQNGAGFGGHVWWAHTRSGPRSGVNLDVTGTWNFDTTLNQWGRVLVHIPDYAAHTQQAKYVIDNGAGVKKERYALQRTREHRWVSLGVMQFNGKPKISLSSRTHDGDGVDDIAWDAVAIQPLAVKPQHFVVALGDSFSSGEGASTNGGGYYYPETDYGGELANNAGRNACHRSTAAWPRVTKVSDRNLGLGTRSDTWDANLDFQFHACSGAKTHNINALHSTASPAQNALGEYPAGQFGEVTQIDKGYLDENTTLVMLSVGGNDARFSDVIKMCITGIASCHQDWFEAGQPVLAEAVPDLIENGVKDSLTQTLRQINQRAPNAKIMLMGYPPLLSGTCVSGISGQEMNWLNDVATNVMTPMMEGVVTSLQTVYGIDVTYADPTGVFSGKAICGTPELIHGINADITPGDKPPALGLFPPSTQSFHPKVEGALAYSTVATSTLAAMGF